MPAAIVQLLYRALFLRRLVKLYFLSTSKQIIAIHIILAAKRNNSHFRLLLLDYFRLPFLLEFLLAIFRKGSLRGRHLMYKQLLLITVLRLHIL